MQIIDYYYSRLDVPVPAVTGGVVPGELHCGVSILFFCSLQSPVLLGIDPGSKTAISKPVLQSILETIQIMQAAIHEHENMKHETASMHLRQSARCHRRPPILSPRPTAASVRWAIVRSRPIPWSSRARRK